MPWPERLSRGRNATGSLSRATADEEDDENAVFQEKLSRFEAAEHAFRLLVDKLRAYRNALSTAMELGVDLAQHVEVFFRPPATAAQRELAVKFKEALKGSNERWKKKGDKVFEEDVFTPVKGRLDEIPEVRDYIKRRANALTDWQRKQKKLAASAGKKDRRVEDKRKRCDEAGVLYRSLHDEVTQRCTNIERNLGNFISPSLRSLVSVCADHSRAQATALSDVENMLNAQPPMTPCLLNDDLRVRKNINEPTVLEEDAEIWDNAFSGDIPDDHLSGGNQISKQDLDFDVDSSVEQSATNLPFPKNGSERPLSRSHDLSKRPATHTSVGTSYTSRSSTSTDPVIADAASKTQSTTLSNNGGKRRNHRKPSSDAFVLETADDRSQNSSATNEVLTYRVVEHDFDPREVNEMKIRTGDVVEVLEKNVSRWWFGRCKTHCGLFPENYTRAMSEEEELTYISLRRHSRQRQRQGQRRGHTRRDSRDAHYSNPHRYVPTNARNSIPL